MSSTWMFSLTSQTSGRGPASHRTSSLNATVLNSPLCLLYPGWHPFSSREPKIALHYKISQKCKKNKEKELEKERKPRRKSCLKTEARLIILQSTYLNDELALCSISTHFRLTAFSSWVRVKHATSMSVTDANKHDPHKLFWLSWNEIETNTF